MMTKETPPTGSSAVDHLVEAGYFVMPNQNSDKKISRKERMRNLKSALQSSNAGRVGPGTDHPASEEGQAVQNINDALVKE